jgi:hypothetical protein
MVMQASRQGDPLNILRLRQQLSGPHYVLTVLGAEHANFTDLPLLTPVHWLAGLSGSINEMRATKIVDAYVLAFFNRYLLEKEEPILGASSDFPELKLEVYPQGE